MEIERISDIQNKKYDVIVMGAGIGGLTAAAYLAQRNKKVLIVEQMNYAGGCICSFRHKGYYFDAGPTSVSFMKILSKVYGDLGLWDQIKWNKVQHQVISSKLDFDVKDEKTFIDEMSKIYPESRNELKKLFKHMRKIVNRINPIYDHHPSYKEGFARILAQMTMPIYLFPTVYTASKYTKITKKQTIEKYLKTDNNVRDIFYASGYENIATVDMSFMWDTFTGNLYYPDGGMTAMIQPLVDYLNVQGADILYRAKVSNININLDKKTVKSVELNGNTEISAQYYISNIDYKRTFKSLIGETNLSSELVDKLNKAHVTEPILNLFLGLKVSLENLPVIHNPNAMIFMDDGVPHYMLDNDDPDFYKKVHISTYIPNFNDPTLNEKGKTSMVVAAVGNYHFKKDWMTKEGVRGPEYRALKEEITEVLISRIEQVIPNIRSMIDYSCLATPLTYERYTGTWEGASCGWAGEKNKAFFKNDMDATMGNITSFSNLFMAGQWTYFNGGIPSALTSGRSIGVDVAAYLDKIIKKQKKEFKD